MRVAIFFTPPADDPLTIAAARWLGRDAYSLAAIDRPQPGGGLSLEEAGALTAEPRRYGFHATLKPPFHIAAGHGLGEIEARLAAFCAGRSPVEIPSVALDRLGPFFALVPAGPAPALDALAADVVRSFDAFRAPPSDDEIARRRPDRLTERQRGHLATWGYPYVFEDFRFHMTLTGPVPEARRPAMAEALREGFGRFAGRPLAIDALALFVEANPPSDFMVKTRIPFKRTVGRVFA